MGVKLELVRCTVQLPEVAADAPLPTEFRLLSYGVNTTTKGPLVLDADGASQLMQSYGRHGVDVMIDLEHLSLDAKSANYDPDARGYCKLELRDDGLWACGVRWNADGEARIRGRKQRYISPAAYRTEDGRVVELVNIALCGMPATDNAAPLIAASRRAELVTMAMSVEDVKKAIAAIREDNGDAALTILENIVAAAASGGAEPAPDPGMDPLPASDPAPMPGDDKSEDEAETLAAASRLITLTGGKSLSDSFELVASWKKSHDSLTAERAVLALQRSALESEERDRLTAQLVVLGSETPATAWQDPTVATDLKKRRPSEFLAAVPLAALRARVERLSADPTKPRQPRAPSTITPEGLTPEQLAICERTKCDPKVFLAQLNRTE